MELSFWGACGIVGVGKSDKVITGGASKALPERCKQKIRRLKNSGFQTVEKPLSMIKMGCRVLLALLVLHRAKLLASNQSILALGRSSRQGLGAVVPVKSPFPGERGQGDRGSELEVCFKNILFLQSVLSGIKTGQFYLLYCYNCLV